MSEPSSPQVCLSCKPGEPSVKRETAIADLGCQQSYAAVDGCMKAHRGNVADCREEWDAFRACHEEDKRSKQEGKEEEMMKK